MKRCASAGSTGIRKSVDADSYTNRFTPRRRGQHLERDQHPARG